MILVKIHFSLIFQKKNLKKSLIFGVRTFKTENANTLMQRKQYNAVRCNTR
jgi:hypothetical protein